MPQQRPQQPSNRSHIAPQAHLQQRVIQRDRHPGQLPAPLLRLALQAGEAGKEEGGGFGGYWVGLGSGGWGSRWAGRKGKCAIMLLCGKEDVPNTRRQRRGLLSHSRQAGVKPSSSSSRRVEKPSSSSRRVEKPSSSSSRRVESQRQQQAGGKPEAAAGAQAAHKEMMKRAVHTIVVSSAAAAAR